MNNKKKIQKKNDIKGFKIIQDGSGICSLGFFSLFLYLFFIFNWNSYCVGINYYIFRARKKKYIQ